MKNFRVRPSRNPRTSSGTHRSLSGRSHDLLPIKSTRSLGGRYMVLELLLLSPRYFRFKRSSSQLRPVQADMMTSRLACIYLIIICHGQSLRTNAGSAWFLRLPIGLTKENCWMFTHYPPSTLSERFDNLSHPPGSTLKTSSHPALAVSASAHPPYSANQCVTLALSVCLATRAVVSACIPSIRALVRHILMAFGASLRGKS